MIGLRRWGVEGWALRGQKFWKVSPNRSFAVAELIGRYSSFWVAAFFYHHV
jgi:hypothetical protein